MRELRDADLIKWNDRMKKSPYQVKVNNHNWTNGGMIVCFYARQAASNSYFPNAIPINNINPPSADSPHYIKDVGDPTVSWLFSFSVVDSRKEEFLKILEKLIQNGVSNLVEVFARSSKNETISLDSGIIKSIKESKHEFLKRAYIRYEYSFEGRLSSIMSYITIIEDAIEFFSKIWGYDADGKEHCLLKYPIGTIVSKSDDKSKDFLILDYVYTVYSPREYMIDYIIVEVMSDKDSMVIRYGESETISEIFLAYSRNDRIDNILN